MHSGLPEAASRKGEGSQVVRDIEDFQKLSLTTRSSHFLVNSW